MLNIPNIKQIGEDMYVDEIMPMIDEISTVPGFEAKELAKGSVFHGIAKNGTIITVSVTEFIDAISDYEMVKIALACEGIYLLEQIK